MLLLDFPELPFFKIFRYLDSGSLQTMLYACRATAHYICTNKRRLAKRPIEIVIVKRFARGKSGNGNYERQGEIDSFTEVEVRSKADGVVTIHCFARMSFPKKDLDKFPSCYPSAYYPFKQPIRLRGNWIVWLAEKMWDIRTLSLEGILLQKREVEYVGDELKHSFAEINEIVLTDPLFEDRRRPVGDVITKFLQSLEIHSLKIKLTRSLSIEPMMTKHFLDYLSTLKVFTALSSRGYTSWIARFENSPNRLPSDFFKLSPRCTLHGCILFPMKNLKKAIESWWKDELEFDWWDILLQREFNDNVSLVEALAMPHSIGKYGGLVFTNPSGRRVQFTRLTNTELECASVARWSFQQLLFTKSKNN